MIHTKKILTITAQRGKRGTIKHIGRLFGECGFTLGRRMPLSSNHSCKCNVWFQIGLWQILGATTLDEPLMKESI